MGKNGGAILVAAGWATSPQVKAGLAVAPAMIKKNSRGLYPAPEYALAAMVEGALVDYDTALRIESRYLARLIVSPVAKNMINTFFFNLNAIKSGQSRPQGAARFAPARVGVLGAVAGNVGNGLADAVDLVHGDDVALPKTLSADSPAQQASNDVLLPSPDPRQPAKVSRFMQLGHILQTDRDGSFFRLFATGLRNPVDVAFDAQGELFTYEADMERDIGAPWYRPMGQRSGRTGCVRRCRYSSGQRPSPLI